MIKRYALFLGLLFGLWLIYMAIQPSSHVQILIWIIMGITLLGLLNCTNFLHKERFVKEDDSTQLMDPRAASVMPASAKLANMQANGASDKATPLNDSLHKVADTPHTDPHLHTAPRKKRAVLLVHGFSSNPWLFHKHIPLFEQAGYDVFAPRLPGHGTSPEQFLQSSFTQYYQCVEKTLKQYRPQYEHFHVIGISMGGLLTLKIGEEYSPKEGEHNQYTPTSITTLAAPAIMKDPRRPVLRMLSWIKPYLKGTWDPKDRESDGGEVWLGYNDLFLPQAYSVSMALVEVKAKLADITLPHLMIHAKGDKDVAVESVYYIAAHTSSWEQELWIPDLTAWDHSRHSLFLYDSLRDPLFQRIAGFLARQEQGHLTALP